MPLTTKIGKFSIYSKRWRVIVILIPTVIRVLNHGLELHKFARVHILREKLHIDKYARKVTSVFAKTTFYYITFFLRKNNQVAGANSRFWG